MTHIVMTGADVSMYTNPNGSETAARFTIYAQILAKLRPDSKLTYIAIGAPETASPLEAGGCRIIPVRSLAGLWQALRQSGKIDLITTQTCTEEAWLAYAFALPRGIAVLPQEHNDPFDARNYNGPHWRKLLLRLRHYLALLLLRCAAGVRTVSPAVAEKLKPWLCGKPLAVLPVPVSVSPLPRQENSSTLLFVGRLDPQKNATGFLDIAAEARKHIPDLKIELAGDGVLRPQLEAKAKTLGLTNCTTFHGWLDYTQMAACQSRASLLITPSWYEGFGRVVLEALICGTPVIASNTAGPRFILERDGAGLLFEASNIQGMTKAAIELLKNPAQREDLRQKGYIAAARFSRDSMSREWMDFILHLV